MNTTETKPDNIPSPPEGYRYWGRGSEEKASIVMEWTRDIACLDENWIGVQGWNTELEWIPNLNFCHYAVRVGSDLYCKIWGDEQTPTDKECLSVEPRKTLLDEFAMAAMQALLINPEGRHWLSKYAGGSVSKAAYVMADAMLAEKLKREGVGDE